MDIAKRWYKNGLVKPNTKYKIVVKTIDGVEHDDIKYINVGAPPIGVWAKYDENNCFKLVNDTDIACWRYESI